MKEPIRLMRFAKSILHLVSLAAMCGCSEIERIPDIPSPPSCLGVVSSTLNSITLQWEAGAHALSFRIYRARGADSLRLRSEITSTTWTDTDLDPAVEYTYRVTSVGTDGINWSEIKIRAALVHAVVRTVSVGATGVTSPDMALDPTGTIFASLDSDIRGVRFWNTADWTLRGLVRPESTGRTSCVAFSADGSTAYLGGLYGVETIRMSDLQFVKYLQLCGNGPGDSIYVEDVVPVPGGTRGVVVSDRGRLQVWDLVSDSLVQTVDSIGPTRPQANAVSPDGRRLAAVWSHGLVVWDLLSKTVLYAASGYPLGPLFNGDGTLLSVSANDGWPESHRRLTLSTQTWLPVCTVFADGSSASFRPDGQYQLIASGHGVRVARLPSGEVEENISGHLAYVVYVSYLADGKSFMTRDARNVVRIWSGDTSDGWSIVF